MIQLALRFWNYIYNGCDSTLVFCAFLRCVVLLLTFCFLETSVSCHSMCFLHISLILSMDPLCFAKIPPSLPLQSSFDRISSLITGACYIYTLPCVFSFHVFVTSFHSPMGLISVFLFFLLLLWRYCLRNALQSSEAGRGLWGGLQRLLVRRTTTRASAV